MLGHGKIHNETPNVVDAGDMPPSRPSRKLQNVDMNTDEPQKIYRDRPSFSDKEDLRMKFKPSLSRTIKLDYSLAADDEPNPQSDHYEDHDDADPAVEDVEIGQEPNSFHPTAAEAQRSPSMDNARLFAATMLAETERRASSRDLMGGRSPRSKGGSMKWPRRGRRDQFQGLRTEATDNDENLYARAGILKPTRDRKQWKNCRRIAFALLCFNVIFIFSLFAYRAVSSRRDDYVVIVDEDTSARFEAAVEALSERGVSDRNALLSRTSPQYQAVYWLAAQDEESLPVPGISDSDPFHFIQRYVLATLYYTLGGANWINSLNFVTSEHECSWFESVADESGERFAVGVSCDDKLQVRNILISSNNVKGQIPSEISHLSNLDFLSFMHNQLSGTIPTSLAALTRLEYLDLKYNELTGSIPDFVGDFKRLEVLGLSKNQLTGELPAFLENAPLKTLSLDDNLLTGDISVVGSISTLEYLYAEDNNLTGRLDDGLLVNLDSIREIDLSQNSLKSDSIPHKLFMHPKLRILDLHDNELQGSIPPNLPQTLPLEYLSLRQNSIGGPIPDKIHHLGYLRHLDLEDNSITGSLPAESLGMMTSLEYLFLGKNPMDNSTIPDELSMLTSLQELSLDGLGLNGPIPAWIEDMTELKLLDLRMNDLTGEVMVDFSNMPALSYVMLSDNLLSGALPQGMGMQPNLQVVSLHHNSFEGEASTLCAASSEVQVLATDCAVVSCPCCEECCDGDDCYQEVVFDALENVENDWESGFKRSNYAFNPHILYKKSPKGIN